MSVDLLNSRTLVLNKAWQPVNTLNVKDAIGKIYCGAAKALGKDYVAYDFEAWIQTWSDLSVASKIDQHKFISCQRFNILVPEVIILNDYKGSHRREARFSRRNIFIRDNYTCQYCHKKFSPKELNIDHVIPRSRGGKTTWDNVALSCIKCNTVKGARTPKEAGMKILKTPKKPRWSALQCQMGTAVPESWRSFVDSYYWNVSLTDED
ncbi:MAG: HNH endonuclease [Lentisphaeraceae bacterium]|nr:HNH endonuclease [Lentisphaeraceae bacterium]